MFMTKTSHQDHKPMITLIKINLISLIPMVHQDGSNGFQLNNKRNIFYLE